MRVSALETTCDTVMLGSRPKLRVKGAGLRNDGTQGSFVFTALTDIPWSSQPLTASMGALHKEISGGCLFILFPLASTLCDKPGC